MQVHNWNSIFSMWMKLQYFCLFSFVNAEKNPLHCVQFCQPFWLTQVSDVPIVLVFYLSWHSNEIIDNQSFSEVFFNTKRNDFVYLEENLVTHTTLIDKLLALSVLSDEDKADFKDVDNTKCGKLLKKKLRKGEVACAQFRTILGNREYVSLQNRQRVFGKSWTYPLCANWHIRP